MAKALPVATASEAEAMIGQHVNVPWIEPSQVQTENSTAGSRVIAIDLFALGQRGNTTFVPFLRTPPSEITTASHDDSGAQSHSQAAGSLPGRHNVLASLSHAARQLMESAGLTRTSQASEDETHVNGDDTADQQDPLLGDEATEPMAVPKGRLVGIEGHSSVVTGDGFVCYVTPLLFGTPGKQVFVIVDTGSSALAVAGKKCRNADTERPCVGQRAQPAGYSADESTSAVRLPLMDAVQYDLGSWEGHVVSDVVNLSHALPRLQDTRSLHLSHTVHPTRFEIAATNAGIQSGPVASLRAVRETSGNDHLPAQWTSVDAPDKSPRDPDREKTKASACCGQNLSEAAVQTTFAEIVRAANIFQGEDSVALGVWGLGSRHSVSVTSPDRSRSARARPRRVLRETTTRLTTTRTWNSDTEQDDSLSRYHHVVEVSASRTLDTLEQPEYGDVGAAKRRQYWPFRLPASTSSRWLGPAQGRGTAPTLSKMPPGSPPQRRSAFSTIDVALLDKEASTISRPVNAAEAKVTTPHHMATRMDRFRQQTQDVTATIVASSESATAPFSSAVTDTEQTSAPTATTQANSSSSEQETSTVTPASSKSAIVPIVSSLVAERKLASESFSVLLCGIVGRLFLGSTGQDVIVRGGMSYVQLLQQSSPHYVVRMTEIKIGSHRMPLRRFRAIVDTGSTFLLLPPAVYDATVKLLRSAVPSADPAIWSGYCTWTDPALWPPLTIDLGNVSFTATARAYLTRQEDFFCLGIGTTHQNHGNTVILGATVLQGVYLHFDRQQKRLGLGIAVDVAARPTCGQALMSPDSISSDLAVRKLADNNGTTPLQFSSSTCQTCTGFGMPNLWCPSGSVSMLLDGRRIPVVSESGFCWPGSFLGGMDQTHMTDVYIDDIGLVSLVASCSASPFVHQCMLSRHTASLALLVPAILACIALLLMQICGTPWRVYLKRGEHRKPSLRLKQTDVTYV